MDVSSILGGDDWRERLRDALGNTAALLAVIGPGWLGEHRSRLDDPDDWVRVELETARALGCRVIPILAGVPHLTAADLPAGRSVGMGLGEHRETGQHHLLGHKYRQALPASSASIIGQAAKRPRCRRYSTARIVVRSTSVATGPPCRGPYSRGGTHLDVGWGSSAALLKATTSRA